MRDLWPNKKYYYKIGHELSNGSVVWGQALHFPGSPVLWPELAAAHHCVR
uniref:PAP27 n=1 Tax=Arundo donax TaxID=35708 RepID=A0A0A9EWI4_ARUDO